MRLLILGGLRLEGSDFTRPKPLLLLTYLALEGPQDRRYLAELFWPQATSAMKSLNVALTQVRQGAARAIEVDEPRLMTPLNTDAGDFLALVEQAALEQAEVCYKGAFLEGFDLGWGVELEEWVYRTREFLAEQARRVLLDLAAREASEGRFPDAAKRAERAFSLKGASFPEPSDLARLYTLLLAGNSLQVKTVYEEAADFGLELPRSVAEARELLSHAGNSQERLALTSLLTGHTSFVGRSDEVAAIVTMLKEGCRLLSLLGPAGVGKTRLALRCAEQLAEEGGFESVIFITLETAQNERQLLRAIATGLEPATTSLDANLEQIASSIGQRSVLLILDNLEQLLAGIGILSELLTQCPNVQLLATSRERLNLAEEQAFPVTGLSFPKEPVSLEEAHSFDAVNLFVRRAGRAQPAFVLDEGTLPAVLEICRLVEGLPLGLELAAAWLRLMSAPDIAQELSRNLDLLETSIRNVPARHQNIRNAFSYSWQLLNEKERLVFAQLAVFRGGFRREAAGVVAGVTISTLASLIDKSLVRSVPPDRYDLHPLLWQYAREKLAEYPDSQSCHRRHAEYFLTLAEAAAPHLTGPEQAPWLSKLDVDHDNLRTAFDWLKVHNVGLGMRLAVALWRFWIMRAHNQEGRFLLEELVALPEVQARTKARASILHALGTITFETGDFVRAKPVLQAALSILREQGERHDVARVLNALGWITAHLGEAETSQALSEEALALNEQLGNTRGMALSLTNLGFRAGLGGRFPEAHRHLTKSLELRQQLGDKRGIAYANSNLAWVNRCLGRFEVADKLAAEALETVRELGDKQLISWVRYQQINSYLNQGHIDKAQLGLQEAVPLSREIGNRESLGTTLTTYADFLCDQRCYEEAAAQLEEAERIWRESGYPWVRALTYRVAARVAYGRDKPDEAQGALQQGLDISLEIKDRHGEAECLEQLALLKLQPAPHAAVRLLAVADGLRTTSGAPLPPRFGPRYKSTLEALRQHLGGETFKTLWQEGKAAGLGTSFSERPLG